MKLGLIAMSGLRAQNEELMELGLTLPGFLERKKVIASLPSLGLLTLAGLTPNNIDIMYIELNQYTNHDDLPGEFDVVAISSFTAQINQAYALSNQYRILGTKVILGGLHVTTMPNEAACHADAIVLGEGEVTWQTIMADLKNNNLKPVYDGRNISFDLSLAPLPDYELLDINNYNRLTVQTQRGCPFQCEFCASSILLSSKYKHKPVNNVVDEINSIKSFWDKPFIELADDNSFANKKHAKELVRAISKLNVKWFTETDISVAEDEELLALLRDSGCRQLLIGLESPITSGLHHLELKTNWKEKQRDKYYSAIQKIQSYGITVNGCFVMGLDGEDYSSFSEVFKFVEESDLSDVQITIQTPFPGTVLYERLKESGRLLEDQFWDKCTLFDVTYVPDKLSVTQLETGFKDLMRDIYSDEVVAKRKEKFRQRIKDRLSRH